MKKNIALESLNTGDIENTSVELASICPLCNHAISPTVLFASLIEYDYYEKTKYLFSITAQIVIMSLCPLILLILTMTDIYTFLLLQ